MSDWQQGDELIVAPRHEMEIGRLRGPRYKAQVSNSCPNGAQHLQTRVLINEHLDLWIVCNEFRDLLRKRPRSCGHVCMDDALSAGPPADRFHVDEHPFEQSL